MSASESSATCGQLRGQDGGNDSPTAPVGLLRRLAVMCYDGLLLFAVLFGATLMLLPVTAGESIAPNNPLFSIYLAGVSYAFFAWFWIHGGQTLGMRAWRVTLVADPPGVLSWRRCLWRFLAACLSWAALGLGFLWAAVDREKLAWHDRASGTRLVYRPGQDA